MVERNALVLVDGNIQELPSGDTLAGASGGGGPSAAHRYWRVKIEEPGNAFDAGSLAGAEFRAIAGGPNIATGGTPSVDSNFGGDQSGNIFDENPATAWSGAVGSLSGGTSFFQYDFGAGNEVWVAEYMIQARSGGDGPRTPRGWFLQHSDDGTNWTTVHTVTGEPQWTGSEIRTYTNPTSPALPAMTGAEITNAIDTFLGSTNWREDPPNIFRYWRLVIDQSGTQTPTLACIAEMELREIVGGTDVATGGTASASNSDFSTSPADAFDDNLSNFWGSDAAISGDDVWLQYDFGAGNEKWIAEYVIVGRTGGEGAIQTPQAFRLQFSEDGITWTDADARSGQSWGNNNPTANYTVQMAQPSSSTLTATEIIDLLDTEFGNTDWRTSALTSGPNGNSSDFLTTTANANSTSGFALKGNIISVSENRYLTEVLFDVGGGYTQEISLVVAEVSEVNPGTITSVLLDVGQVSVSNPADGASFAIPTPILLEQGKFYLVTWVRTGGTGSSAVQCTFPGLAADTDPAGFVTVEASCRESNNAPAPGDTMFYQLGTSSVVGMTIRTEGETFTTASMTGAEIVAAIDAQLGNQDWQSGGSGGGGTDLGQKAADLTWDTNQFALSTQLANGDPYTVERTGGSQNWEYFVISKEPLPSTGVHYFEILVEDGSMSDFYAGIVGQNGPANAGLSTSDTAGWDHGIVRYNTNQVFRLNTSSLGVPLGTWNGNTDVLRILYDADRDRISFGANGVAPNVDGTENSDWFDVSPVPGPNRYICSALRYSTNRVNLRTREDQFTESIPAGATPAQTSGLDMGLNDIGDVSTFGGTTGDVLTQQADGSFAMQAPSGGSMASMPDVNITPGNLDASDLNRPLGLLTLTPTPQYGLLAPLQSVPVTGGYTILAENDFGVTPGTSLTVADTHLYDEIHMYFFDITAGGGLFGGIYPDGVNPSAFAATRLRIFGNNATPDTGATDEVGMDKLFIASGISISGMSGRIIWRGTKAGVPLTADKISGQQSGDYFHQELNVYESIAEVRGLDFNTNSGTITSGVVIIVGVQNAVQIMPGPFNYTGTPAGVETLGRFVVPINARIRQGAQGQFKNGTNNTAASSVNINIAGGSTIGTISLPDTGDPVVNITADTDLNAGDVLEIVTTQAETFTDLYGTLLLEGRG